MMEQAIGGELQLKEEEGHLLLRQRNIQGSPGPEVLKPGCSQVEEVVLLRYGKVKQVCFHEFQNRLLEIQGGNKQ